MAKPQDPRTDLMEAFYESLTALLRLYQFRDRDRISLSGVTASQAYVLDAIARLGPSWITRIAKELHLNKSSASRLVDSLEEANLVRRERDPDNHRASFIHLTAAGRRKCDRLARQVKSEYLQALSELPEEVVVAMIEALERIRYLAEKRMTTQGEPKQ
jgi:MarR family transcriptional regulator, 2-MHQ and catechol-resistance regulon repressor